MLAYISLNGNDYFITWHENKFGACSGIGKTVKYMKVKDNFENCYKLYKTLVYAHHGAKGVYNWIVLCSHYQTNMYLAEKFVKHVIGHGKGIR